MLRAYYLACDFYPKIMFAGDKPDLAALLDALDQAIASKQHISIQDHQAIHLYDFNLTITVNDDLEEGVFQTTPQHFLWQMSQDTALDFYQDLEELLCQPQQSGSLIFEMLRLDEIKIKISMNEFDDSYLQS